MTAVVVVRVRGDIRIRFDAVDTLKMLRLNRPNHCVILPDNATTKGMLQVVKDYVTWGDVTSETIAKLLFQRGLVMGGDALTDAYVKDNSPYTSIISLAKAMEKGEAKLKDVAGLKPVMRLPPPRQGYGKVKNPWSIGGAVGYRGADISKLIDKMLAKPPEVE
ncbi:MAG: 50S ribosomal protein L30 [Thermoplasmata archaeon]|jgi:large subunit ribosomal protein L30|nr:50S ribosomal protein L30 [Thermoplasmata archaeon]